MEVMVDQYGTIGRCPGAYFDPEGDISTSGWLCSAHLMLIDGQDLHWLSDEDDWGRVTGVEFNLPDDVVMSDTVNDARTTRTSSFLVEIADLQVDLIQETPSAGYNFLQTYTIYNTGNQPKSLKVVWFNDQDLQFTGTAFENRVGFVPGKIPRAYFIEESDLSGPGGPGFADRNHRISVAATMGDGVTLDGYYGVKAKEGGAGGMYLYLERNGGILGADLNTIQLRDFFSADPAGEDLDTDLDIDADLLIDEPGDVGAAMQFSIDLAAGASTSLAFDYIGGSLSRAVFDIVPKPLPGDFDLDGSLTALDIDQLSTQIRVGGNDVRFDVNGDSRVDRADHATWVHDLRKTYFGDANLDGQFNSTDMIAVFQAGQYEDTFSGNSGWSSGDWDGDGDFTTGDLVAAFQDGGYEKGPRAAIATVPEPNVFFMFLFGFLVCLRSSSSRT